MNAHFNSQLLCALALCTLAGPVLAIGSQALDRQLDTVTRQVEQRADRAIERALDRRLESVEQRIEARADQAIERLPELPPSVSINTQKGRTAFNDVLMDTGYRAVERQWLATGTASEMAELERPGITILAQRELSGLGILLVRFRVAPALDSLSALQTALPGLAEQLDRNHIYAPQNEQSAAAPQQREVTRPQWQSLCHTPLRIGMIDTAIALEHPVFEGTRVVQENFLQLTDIGDSLTAPTGHGTAVASLMVGHQADQWPARLPGATLFNASVFYGSDRDLSGATLGHLLEGFNWLAEQKVSVINISLTGPDNRLLRTAVDRLNQQGIAMVAAVGNGGPAAPPLFPAAYPEVIGVTAVNASGELYRWANRGEQVLFSALGVDVPVAQPGGGLTTDSGTSLAAPVVSSALACRLDSQTVTEAIASLAADAKGLGEPGRNARFGHGLLDY